MTFELTRIKQRLADLENNQKNFLFLGRKLQSLKKLIQQWK